jgi:CPA1 family monovalent cation:H+ antiporter
VHIATEIVLLVALVAAGSVAATRLSVPAPLLLLGVGVAASYVPDVPEYELDPELVLVGILPPLLYAAAIRTSLRNLRRDRRAIGLLSVGLVAFTCVIVGYVAWWLVPGLPLAAGFALGAVVAPPDAVAATAVARRVRMPRRLVDILEGESLVNDATALVALSTSVAALAGGVTAGRIGFEFLVAAGGGVVVGLLVAVALAWVRKRIDDTVLDVTFSLLAPFVAFIAAEEIHVDGAHPSGVLAVVIVGIALGQWRTKLQSASSRVAEQLNWATVQFVLENAVFLLIGLQLRAVLDDAGASDLGWGRMVLVAGAVLLTAIVTRFVWVFPATYLPRWLVPSIQRNDPAPPWTHPFVVGWAGMRGVVTLAAVFALPKDTPERPVLVLTAFVVVAGTLLLQGATLPGVVRRLHLPGPDPAAEALAEANALQAAARAGIAAIDDFADLVPPEVLQRARDRSLDRANQAWERLGTRGETPSEIYAKVRLKMLAAERLELSRLRDAGGLDEEVLQRVQRQLDIEESTLDRLDDEWYEEGAALLGGPGSGEGCAHLAAAASLDPEPPEDLVCPACVADGLVWVHLRMCVACGAVGCCDSSVGRHAAAHFAAERHPVMRSIEPGEAWRWCYEDELLD